MCRAHRVDVPSNRLLRLAAIWFGPSRPSKFADGDRPTPSVESARFTSALAFLAASPFLRISNESFKIAPRPVVITSLPERAEMPDPTLEQLDQSLKQLRKEFDHGSEGLHIVTGVVSKLRDQVDDLDKVLKPFRKEFDHDSEGLHIVTGVVSKLRDQVDDIDKESKQLRKEFDHDSDGLHILTAAASKLSDQFDDKAKSTLDAIKDLREDIKDLAKRVAALEKKK
jgi:predicted nuclease with TOPRIM domain